MLQLAQKECGARTVQRPAAVTVPLYVTLLTARVAAGSAGLGTSVTNVVRLACMVPTVSTRVSVRTGLCVT